jgi:signal transduction histidine kinase
VRARLDAAQLELVLLNLARNAADAMPEGGELVVGTRALPAGEAADVLNGKAAVELFVADTGAGMAPEVLERATELFFTTRRPAMAPASACSSPGIRRPLRRQADARSEPGRGTTARMVFPPAA